MLASLPHVRRDNPTITLLFEGEGYNHRHLNVRLATLEAHPVHPVHTVLTEYSEAVEEDLHRITFSGYRYYGARLLEVYYRGDWYVAVLDALEDEGTGQTDGAAEDAAPNDQPPQVLSNEELDHLLDHLGR
jgi:hypothetical protein